MRRILVVNGIGDLGSAISETLLEKHREAVILLTGVKGIRDNTQKLIKNNKLKNKPVNVLFGDVSDRNTVRSWINQLGVPQDIYFISDISSEGYKEFLSDYIFHTMGLQNLVSELSGLPVDIVYAPHMLTAQSQLQSCKEYLKACKELDIVANVSVCPQRHCLVSDALPGNLFENYLRECRLYKGSNKVLPKPSLLFPTTLYSEYAMAKMLVGGFVPEQFLSTPITEVVHKATGLEQVSAIVLQHTKEESPEGLVWQAWNAIVDNGRVPAENNILN